MQMCVLTEVAIDGAQRGVVTGAGVAPVSNMRVTGYAVSVGGCTNTKSETVDGRDMSERRRSFDGGCGSVSASGRNDGKGEGEREGEEERGEEGKIFGRNGRGAVDMSICSLLFRKGSHGEETEQALQHFKLDRVIGTGRGKYV